MHGPHILVEQHDLPLDDWHDWWNIKTIISLDVEYLNRLQIFLQWNIFTLHIIGAIIF